MKRASFRSAPHIAVLDLIQPGYIFDRGYPDWTEIPGNSMRIEGEAVTADAQRIIRRLCRHWSHKFHTSFDDNAGTIQLNEVFIALKAEPGRVRVSLENPGGEVPQRLAAVVAEHMQRMAGTESPLDVRWSEPTTG
jgi:uncharacterized protein